MFFQKLVYPHICLFGFLRKASKGYILPKQGNKPERSTRSRAGDPSQSEMKKFRRDERKILNSGSILVGEIDGPDWAYQRA